MWILLNNKPVNVLDINMVSDITTVSRNDWLERISSDCNYGMDKSSILLTQRAFNESPIKQNFPRVNYGDYGSLVCLIRDNWEVIKTIFPESISWFYIEIKGTLITSDIYGNPEIAINTRNELLSTINTVISELPKIRI